MNPIGGGMVPFDPDDSASVSTRWKKWKRMFEIFLDVNNVQLPSRKKSYLLHCAGESVQDIYVSLVGEQEPPVPDGSDLYKEAIRVLDEHFLPMKCLPQERHIFRNLEQGPDEKISRFVLRLREQGNLCEYGNWLEENIKEQIFEKGKSDELRAKILQKPNMTLEETLNEGRALETIEKVRQELHRAAVVNKVSASKQECFRCGNEGHFASSELCPAKNTKCRKCGLVGHFWRCCNTKAKHGKQRKVQQVAQEPPEPEEEADDVYVSDDTVSNVDQQEVRYVFAASTEDAAGEKVVCCIGGVKIKWVVDSGAGVNVMDNATWTYLKQRNVKVISQTKEPRTTLKAYGNNSLKVLGQFRASIATKNHETIADVFVVEEDGASLLSKTTATELQILKINTDVWSVSPAENAIGKITGIEVHLQIDPLVKPVQITKCHIPIPLQEKVEREIDLLLAQDIIEVAPIDSPWISRLVVSPKAGDPSAVRLCVDMRAANKAIVPQHFPLPTFEDIVPHLRDCKWFSKVDLIKAFHQAVLAPDSRYITTFATHHGYYRYKRLLFGMNIASEVFQSIMERVLKGTSGVKVFIDDILVFGSTKQQHEAALKAVMHRLTSHGITVNPKKCFFGKSEVTFMGHVLSADGVRPTLDKVEAIKRLREPKTPEEVRSFLGMITYLGRFIPELSTLTSPLRELLRKDSEFVWGPSQQQAFQKLKELLKDAKNLGYYSPHDKTIVIADAGPTGLGAVLIQEKDGRKRVICYISKGLSDAEKSYAQNEKEALALVWAAERLQIYLRGLTFLLLTDHEPLKVIFGPNHVSCPRIDRWAMRLQSFRFTVIHIPGKVNIADPLSRLPAYTKCKTYDQFGEEAVLAITQKAVPTALTTEEIASNTVADVVLSRVKEALKTGRWNDEVKKFAPFKEELYCCKEILLRGERLVIPQSLQKRTLALAHIGHPGIERSKQRLRSKVWWPEIDKDVEQAVRKCLDCQIVGRMAPPEPMAVRQLPSSPWEFLSMLGPLPTGESLLVIIDCYSRFRIIEVLKQTTSADIIGKLRPLFMRMGIPSVLMNDNARNFTSNEMEDFCNSLGIRQRRTTPYWPQANGETERQNRSILKILKIAELNKSNWKKDLEEFNYAYALTPHPATGRSPAELAFGRQFRDWIPQLSGLGSHEEEVEDKDKSYKYRAKCQVDATRGARESSIELGDQVLMKNMNPTNKLSAPFLPQPAKVISKQGNSVVVETPEGVKYRRNSSHLKKVNTPDVETEDEDLQWATPTQGEEIPEKQPDAETNRGQTSTTSTRSGRQIKRPLRFQDFIVDVGTGGEQGTKM
ncbi:uncharacterized protein K02A2.6-like [Culex pipiens pallens]|uniref:uncharacterized protein K02A2.6-like n=1 Tax=Culex pipiens pallens TaxID=42434 RepID=UPI0019539C3D|nr:uncharacterized protein K02A2.6-like [Culex pipiens pallens]